MAASFLVSLALLQAGLPSGGTSLLGPEPMARLGLLGQQNLARLTRVPVSGMSFTEAVRVETLERPRETWMVQLGSFTTEKVEQGDVVLVQFWARAIQGQPETGEARSLVAFATGGPDWARSFSQALGITKTWRQYSYPFTVLHSRPANESLIAFDLGYNPQSFEVGGFQILNYRKSTPIGSLPMTKTRYAGDEPNAAWRKQADQRIDKIRKGGFTLRVLDPQGRPVRGAQVAVEQTRHAFPFGTAVAANVLTGQGADNDRYRQALKEHFNFAAIENHLKWPFWETWGREDGVKALNWLRENRYPVRGHTIVWPGWGNLPDDVKGLEGNREGMRKRIDGRIREIIGSTKGQINEWDVANELYTNNDVFRTIPWDDVAEWFRLTHKLDPKPRLTLNDYPPLDGGDTGNPHLEFFYNKIDSLLKAKAPLQAIGFQCHFGSSVVPPERVLKGLDRFSKFGVPIVITEFDMDTVDDDLKARYMRDFMTAAFSHPNVANITQWGFWEGSHWMPNAALWRRDWTLRPHGRVYLDLIHKQWRTTLSGRTTSAGRFAGRGFFGDYRVSATVGGRKLSGTFSVAKGAGGVATVRLRAE